MGGSEKGGHTIAKNVYERLLFARKARKFIVAKALKRCTVNFVSGPPIGCVSYVHRAALSISTFMARYQQRVSAFLNTISGGLDIVRTRMIDSSTCIHAPLVARCTRHNLKLIEALYSS